MTPSPRTLRPAPFAGVIEVRGILGGAVLELGTRIVRGDWAEGAVIPREADLVADLGVSRSVVREAFRILGAKGMVRSRTSDGTRVTPRSDWRQLDPDVMDWRIKAGESRALLTDLLKVRLVMEPGFAYEATRLANDADRARVEAAWLAKIAVFEQPAEDHLARRDAFIETDLVFHRTILSIIGSELLDQLFSVIDAALRLLLDLQMRARGYDTRLVGMDESHAMHQRVCACFMRGDPAATEAAMRALIGRAIEDAQDGFALLEE